MAPEVDEAIAEIKAAFPDNNVEVTPEPQGGAYVVVQDLPLGPQYRPERAWVGFLIGFQYPDADVYPHYTEAALSRVDGAPLGEGIQQPVQWHDRVATQISRRSIGWNAADDTAALKLRKVLDWLATL